MPNDQFEELIQAVDRLSAMRTYTLAGAADWYMLVSLGGFIVVLLIYIWQDLKKGLSEDRVLLFNQVARETVEREKQIDILWKYIRDCQNECCPRKRNVHERELRSNSLDKLEIE